MRNLRKKLAFKTHLARHLAELRQLLNRDVQLADLLPIDDSDDVLEKSKLIHKVPSWKREIPFSDRSGPRFQALIKALNGLHPAEVYVWTPLANLCGLPRPVPLLSINFSFPFDVNPDGIFSVITSDLTQRILFDYFEEDQEQTLELEVSGDRWGTARY